MKKVLLVLVLGSAILVTSCKKDGETAPQKNNAVKVNDSGNIKKLDSAGNWD
ncbi:hypothetical protein [Pelobium manganitolerans]|uniref:hypothetical protein n=1 Tax=Pelobium manganitolerans TaxID=1842495 RepID=UPI003FA349FF